MSYLKQVIVVRKDLSMPTGKLAAMVVYAAMTSMVRRLQFIDAQENEALLEGWFTDDPFAWLTELDPGIEETGQVSFAKIVLAVNSEEELLIVRENAELKGLECHSVYDSGYSHNKAGDFVCIAIGPDWPEVFEGVTGHLKAYR